MARRTDQIARVVIIAQAPDYDCSRLPAIAILPVLPALATLTHRLTPPRLTRISRRVGFTPGHPDDAQRIALDRAAKHPRMYRTILADRRARLAALPLDAQIREVGLPVLAILGGRDCLNPSAPIAARYRAAGARVVVIDDAEHSVNVQRPAEVADLIRDGWDGATFIIPRGPYDGASTTSRRSTFSATASTSSCPPCRRYGGSPTSNRTCEGQMTDAAPITVTVVTSQFEAELIVGLLRDNGLDAFASADDAGGQEPQLQLQGVRVLVARADESAARQILADAESGQLES
jgi:hypothetical protein